jgi:cytochrome oxidase assembly protein ShyY1
VYRFLATPRWIGLGLLMTLAAATMVGLGLWQLDRYHYRDDINTRIDAAADHPPRQLADVLAGPGIEPAAAVTWSLVTVTGHYDPAHEILARARTVDGVVGFEVVTPLVLPAGDAILIDRGWLPAPDAAATAAPVVPPAPTGDVTVIGRVHAPESRATAAEPFDGRLAVRRIGPAELAASIPYSLYGAYLTLEGQTPPADAAFVGIPPDHENSTMNAGYVLQWWAFAALTLSGFVYLAYREAHPLPETRPDRDDHDDRDPAPALSPTP